MRYVSEKLPDVGHDFVSDALFYERRLHLLKVIVTAVTPTDNATVESFNDRLRQECLNESWFRMPGAKSKPGAYTITRVVPILRWTG